MAKGTGSLFEAAKLDNLVIHVPADWFGDARHC